MGPNILLDDLMNFTDINKIPGILHFIDFEKAFDTAEWSFLHQALEIFNFGPKVRNKGGKFLKKLWCCVGGSITR